jgi:hypothetical protein
MNTNLNIVDPKTGKSLKYIHNFNFNRFADISMLQNGDCLIIEDDEFYLVNKTIKYINTSLRSLDTSTYGIEAITFNVNKL